jgi:uncharacterized membrane protein
MTEPSPNDTDRAVPARQPHVSNYGLALTVYILYLVGFYLQRDETDPICQSHFQFQITTFWIGLLYFFVGFLTIHIVIGAFILIWWVIWTFIRCVNGLLILNKGNAIP